MIDRLLQIKREVGMPQVVELASESEGFSLNTADFSQLADLRTGVSPRVEWPISRLQPTPHLPPA